MQVLKNYSNEYDYSDAVCFLAVFISHGTEGKIVMKEDRLDIEEHIFRLFRGNKCKRLLGKPKIFIFAVSVINELTLFFVIEFDCISFQLYLWFLNIYSGRRRNFSWRGL